MEQQDRQAIEGVFRRLADLERNGQPREPEAEAFIAEQMHRQPGAPYYMAQTIVAQQRALESAEARLNGAPPPPSGMAQGLAAQPQEDGRRGPWGGGVPAGRGGGFLAGAAQTAVGVAGGVLLGSAIGGLFSGDEAQAADPGADAGEAADAGADVGSDEGGGFLDGLGDW